MKVAIYCRLSEEDRNKQSADDDSNSIQNQKSMLLQYSLQQGWEVYNIYSDDDYTGSDRKRPQFIKLIQDAEHHRFDIILCKTQSRFTREMELVEKYIHGLFPIWGIRFVSIIDNADTANRGNKKSRQINGLVNEWYLEDMSENIKGVLTSRRLNGLHIGAFAPYGYQKDPNLKGHLIIDEEAASVIREIFQLYSEGYGKQTIAKILNAKGIPNPTEYKRLKGIVTTESIGKNSTLWRYYTITSVLENEVYIGNMVQGRYGSVSYKTKVNKPRPKELWYRVEGTHEPIIERELWNKVQDLVKQRAKPYGIGEIGMFAGKLKCAYCGYVMYSGKNRGARNYRCRCRDLSPSSCIGAYINHAYLEGLVLKEINRMSEEYLNRDEVEQKIEFCQEAESHRDKMISDAASYTKKIAEYTKGIKELYLDKVKGLIGETDFVEMSKDFVSERERLERLVVELNRQIDEINEQIAIGDNRREIVEKYAHLNSLNRDVVNTLIDYIVVSRRIPGTKQVPIEIHWKF